MSLFYSRFFLWYSYISILKYKDTLVVSESLYVASGRDDAMFGDEENSSPAWKFTIFTSTQTCLCSCHSARKIFFFKKCTFRRMNKRRMRFSIYTMRKKILLSLFFSLSDFHIPLVNNSTTRQLNQPEKLCNLQQTKT